MINSIKDGKTVVVGGDERQVQLCEWLCTKGMDCTHIRSSLDEESRQTLKQADCVILPLPVTRDGIHIFCPEENGTISIDELCALLSPRQRIFGGMISTAFHDRSAADGLSVADYYTDDALTQYNASLTAQGLLRIVLDNTQRSLSRRVLVTGYGRVARATAKLFACCGADVTVAARSERDRAQAVCDGMTALDFPALKSRIFIYDIIVNTVPCQVLDKALIRSVRKDALLLEAASAPYGIDIQAARQYKKTLLMCPSLPGRFTAVSAGRVIADTVLRLAGEG